LRLALSKIKLQRPDPCSRARHDLMRVKILMPVGDAAAWEDEYESGK
jgi:hypothetical protein